jgi:hypothetical protein
MSLKSLENKVGQFGIFEECESYEVNYTEDYLDEICEILEDSFIQPGKFLSTNIALSLFSKFSEFGLKTIKSSNKEICKPENQVDEKIKELLALNSLKIKNYLTYFPDLLFNDTYYPETICELRSGIEFLFDFYGDSVYEGKKLKELFDPKGSEISDLDASIKNWLEDNYKPEIKEKYPQKHWWWQEQTKLITIDTNQHSIAASTEI